LKSANDLYLANTAGTAWTNGTTTAFSRFCSGDLAAATAFKTTTAGYDGRIYLTGEETGAEGRAFAHIVTGAEAGRVYELPSLGNLSFENILANSKEQAKTVAIALDDSTVDGQVYVYVGTKAATGNAVEKAGLAGGKLFGVKVGTGTTPAQEVADLTKPTETGLALTNGSGSFSLVDLGDVKGKTGAELNTASSTAAVTNFNRPEDGAWSLDGKTFYFATTASTTTASRLWALEFTDSANPEKGGTIKMLLNGSEGQLMFDNITVGSDGNIILQEDPGANDRVAKIWSYNISSAKLTEIAQHDPALFTGTNKITNDEESSGVVEVTSFLNTSKFSYYLVADQIHKTVSDPAEQVEMGQLSLMVVPKVVITPGTVAGIELATPGVSSPGFEKYFPGVTGLDSVFEAYTKDLRYANLQDRGFLDLNISKTQINAGFEYLKGIDPTTNQPTWERDTLITGANNSFKELLGFDTPLLKAKVSGLKISELFTIGEAIGSYIPTGTPDGMGAYLKDANTIRLLV
ncbi:MAG: hypothetical protein EBT27_11015, partial [Betaproteobacteria bacterium]|nr:hypothetical protein [Betaproteobacteria bacterium]